MASPNTIRIEVRSSLSDFNSDAQVPASTWLRWAFDARMEGFRVTALRDLLNTSTVMVKAQVARILSHQAVTPGSLVFVTQSPYQIGRTSFTLKYVFEVDGSVVAEAMCVLVKVGADAGAAQLPAWMHQDLMWDVPASRDLASTTNKVPEDLVVGSSALDHFLKDVGPLRSSHELITRPSDEDTQRHVTHTRTVQFFEDAIVMLKRPVPDLFYVDYVSQLRRNTHCEVRVAANNAAETQVRLLMFLQDKANSPQPVSRAFAQWTTPQLDVM